VAEAGRGEGDDSRDGKQEREATSTAAPEPADPLDVLVFEAVITSYIQRLLAEQRDLAPYFKRLYELSWKHPVIRSLDVDHGTGVAKLKAGTRRETMAEALADAMEAMADITLIETGRPIVLREAADCVEKALQSLGHAELAAFYRRKIMTSGLVPREAVERDEASEEEGEAAPVPSLPMKEAAPKAATPGRQVLLVDETAAERDGYVRKLVGAALRRGDSVLVMLVKQSRRAFLASLGMKDSEVAAAVKAGLVMLVQCKSVPELVEEEESLDEPEWVITVPPDATGVARAVRLWLERRAKPGRKLAVLDIGALQGWEGNDRTLKAVVAVRSRLRRDGVNALYLVDKWTGDPKSGVGFAAGFDEVIEKKVPAAAPAATTGAAAAPKETR
jgi:hypothetical protein